MTIETQIKNRQSAYSASQDALDRANARLKAEGIELPIFSSGVDSDVYWKQHDYFTKMQGKYYREALVGRNQEAQQEVRKETKEWQHRYDSK